MLFLGKNDIIRLDKFISSQMNISRSDAKKLLKKNFVTVNGEVVSSSDRMINTCVDVVSAYGKTISYMRHLYIMLNKPKGVVSASTDNKDITVVDILPDELKRNGLFPAGRLDKDTTGFVLITDDGEFAHNILSPSHHVQKTYIVEIAERLSFESEKRFLDGMIIGEELFKPAELSFISDTPSGRCIYEIKIIEGRYHQIKRMFASTGNPVLELKRVAIGGLQLDSSLAPGEARLISDDELKRIKSDI